MYSQLLNLPVQIYGKKGEESDEMCFTSCGSLSH